MLAGPITECLNTDIPATIETFEWYAETADKVFGKWRQLVAQR